MLTQLKLQGRALVAPLADRVARTGIDPNTITLFGLALNVLAGLVIAGGSFVGGGALFLLASATDSIDGAVARASGRTSSFGAFLDSLADRYAESAILVGLLVRLELVGDALLVVAAALALVGSLLVSYARARAEGLGVDCEVGLLQRPERVVLLAAGLLLSPWLLGPALWLLAVATNLTVVQRALHVHRALAARDERMDGL